MQVENYVNSVFTFAESVKAFWTLFELILETFQEISPLQIYVITRHRANYQLSPSTPAVLKFLSIAALSY